jgi:protein-disulfide isomerase
MSTVEDDEQDLTRKQRREQARAERKAIEEAEAAGAARRKRLIQLGAVVGVVVVIVVVILVATSGGGESTGGKGIEKKTGGKTPAAVAQVTSLLNGIPQSGNVLGNPSAPVTMQYFGDLECPFCRQFTLTALPKVIEKYVRTGKVKLEYRNLETATREPETFRTQQSAALAAGRQNKGWYFIELFYHEQGQEDSGYVTEKYLEELAQQVPGLNLSAWTADRSNPEFTNIITTDAQAANNNGFTGTPSFMLGKSGGKLTKFEPSSFTEASAFESAIDKLLA